VATRQATAEMPVERVQLGVRMEKRLVTVLKGLAKFQEVTLGQLLENILLHWLEAVPGQESEMAFSPHGKCALAAIADLKRVHGMDYDAHPAKAYREDATAIGAEESRGLGPRRQAP